MGRNLVLIKRIDTKKRRKSGRVSISDQAAAARLTMVPIMEVMEVMQPMV